MASGFGHALAAIGIGRAMLLREKWKLWFLGMCCAVIPDVDFLGYQSGIEYGSMFGHRGFTHSFFFAFLLATVVMFAFYRKEQLFSKQWNILLLYFFLATASHPVLDAMTNGGRGVAFFAPFSNERYFFPWRPIEVSPLSITGFFSERGFTVLKSEMIWIGIPSLVLCCIPFFIRKK
jgi:inner membrane protein